MIQFNAYKINYYKQCYWDDATVIGDQQKITCIFNNSHYIIRGFAQLYKKSRYINDHYCWSSQYFSVQGAQNQKNNA